MAKRPRTTPVSITPEARQALNDVVVEITIATRERVTQSDALRIAAVILANHPAEIGAALHALAGPDDSVTPLFKEGK